MFSFINIAYFCALMMIHVRMCDLLEYSYTVGRLLNRCWYVINTTYDSAFYGLVNYCNFVAGRFTDVKVED